MLKDYMYDNWEENTELLSYPEELFQNFYTATKLWDILMDNNTKKAMLLFKYLEMRNVPVTIYDIYTDLAGALIDMSLKDIQSILSKYENFSHLYGGYWILSPKQRTVCEQIEVNQWISIRLAHKPIPKLIKAYIKNTDTQDQELYIEQLLCNLNILGLNIPKEKLENVLIHLNYTEVYPDHWLRYKGMNSLGRFNLRNLWSITLSRFTSEIKNQRDVYIFSQRILNGETLTTIGKTVGVTRERVRQIEQKLKRKMYHNSSAKYIRPFYNWFRNILKKEKIIDLSNIGIPETDYEIFDLIMSNYFNNSHVYRILDNIVIFKPEYERLVSEINQLASYEKIINIDEIPFKPGFSKRIALYEKVLVDCIGMIKINEKEFFYTGKNLTNEDEIYVIIYKAQRPLHYKEVPKLAKKYNLPLSTEPGRNTLATMQRSHLLKRVAPGTYGLTKWNIPKHIYITDLIYKVLEDADRPLYYNEILTRVREHRIDEIKERSVEYYLANHDEIIYIYTKQYILIKWLEQPEKLTAHGIDIQKIKVDDFDNYAPIDKSLLNKAENLWTKGMEKTSKNEAIYEIDSLETLLNFGLEKGYVYYETVKRLVDLGYNPRELLYELNDRNITINY